MNNFLFLQGVSSPFFSRLARGLRARGLRVNGVSFNVGDALYAPGSHIACPSRPEDLEPFYSQCLQHLEVTDIVLFGDCRPVHVPAIRLARRQGLRVHVFEEGYFRPWWITLERDGVNNHSRLPRDPAWYRAVARHVPHYGNGMPFRQSFATRAAHDVIYHAGGALNPLCYPHYRTHAPFSAATEYAGFIRQAARRLIAREHDRAQIEQVVRGGQPTFLLPLQLDSDAQIRNHSSFTDMRGVLEQVLASFARHAPANARLLVKNHPLTPGLVNYRQVTDAIARHHDLSSRVGFLEDGPMPILLDHIAGMVTINSTAGASALQHQRPVFTLGAPVYAIDGLVHDGLLDDFWHAPQPPDSALFKCFRNTVIHTTQINGGFYTRSGIDLAVANALPALMAEKSRIETCP